MTDLGSDLGSMHFFESKALRDSSVRSEAVGGRGAILRPRLARLHRADPVWSHHLVIFVLDDVTVPHILA